MKLIFVYNANSGKLNAMLDTAHKLISPDTYECDLCDLTFGALKEKEEWVRFRESENTPMQFLHKDEFLKRYRSKWLPKYDFPIVLAETNRGLEIAISKEEFQHMEAPEDLIAQVRKVIELFKD